MLSAAIDRQFDEVYDWIDALPDYDGSVDLDDWLVRYAGADARAHSAEYLSMVGTKYVMQALHRAMHPGAKADYSLVLTSAQGGSKDQVLETMFQPYYRRRGAVAEGRAKPISAWRWPGRSSPTAPRCRLEEGATSRSRRRA